MKNLEISLPSRICQTQFFKLNTKTVYFLCLSMLDDSINWTDSFEINWITKMKIKKRLLNYNQCQFWVLSWDDWRSSLSFTFLKYFPIKMFNTNFFFYTIFATILCFNLIQITFHWDFYSSVDFLIVRGKKQTSTLIKPPIKFSS